MASEDELRKQICEAGRRMYAKNLVSATDGNISVRLASEQFLVTPKGSTVGFMKPEDLIIADAAGKKISGDGAVSSEFTTHLAAYEERPDIECVVHAHPPKAVGFTLAGIGLDRLLLPEVVFALGRIPTARYATPATLEGGEAIRELIRECDALLLDRHGAVTVGSGVMDAYFKMEKIEHAAESILTAHLLGAPQELTSDEMTRILAAREAYGAHGKLFL